jgi:RNA polymerase sigma-70 factor, ECF subfamily
VAADFQRWSDEELARQSQDGLLSAFEELVFRYEGRIYGFIANSCRNTVDAREVTQDTFVRAFQAIDQFDGRRGFAPWLFTIARRKCIDHYRAAPPVADEPMPELADYSDPAELLARQEERQGLWGLARRRLPESQFQTLWLRYAEDMSVAGIAQVLRKTQTHVKVLLFRARRVLARELKAGRVSGVASERGSSEPGLEREARASSSRVDREGGRGKCVVEYSRALISSEPCGDRKGSV